VNDATKTTVILGAAAVLAVFATISGPRAVKQDLFSDQGELFFPAFTDPNTAVELEVTQFSAEQATASVFGVRRDKNGMWTIPSHFGYPADAKDRMGKAAAMLIGLAKSKPESDRTEDHVAMGVVDPLDQSADPAGRGTRIKMKDSAGNALADLIVGKEVAGKLERFYVCVPGKRRVYSVELKGELSTRFADWIETDLLKAKSWDMQKVVFDNYAVDEQRGVIVPGDKLVIDKDKDSKWTLAGLDPATEEPNADKLREIADTLTQIKIAGVRPKPEGLTARLEKATGYDHVLLRQSLIDKGFFLGEGGRLYANEGDLLFETKKGVRYKLAFGELVPGSADEVSAGVGQPKAPEAGAEGPAPVAADNRFLMVSAEFVEALLEKPKDARLPKEHMDKRRQAREQLEKIKAAIESWKTGHEGKLPESLAQLLEKPEGGEALLAELPKDPWDGDYQLQVDGEAFAVVCAGEDKALGGEGVAEDLRSDAFQREDDLRRLHDDWEAHDTKVKEGREEADRLTKRFGPWYYVIDKTLFDKLKPKREDLVKPKEKKDEEPKPGEAPGGVQGGVPGTGGGEE
jgi:hypothetical protein